MDWQSPFIVPIGAFAMVLGIVLINTMHRYHVRRLQSEERLAAIARGLPLPPEPINRFTGPNGVDSPERRAAKTRSSAIVLIAVGLGIICGLGVIAHMDNHEVLAGTIGGIIPLFIGIGMWIDYRMQVHDIEKSATPPLENSAPPAP
ncbi:MAG: DUF6249 domain-containing protein [Acidobacteriota bacterium]|nr:DUF6249 domain-containing protein [Acidobacteriota bacterium]